MLKKIILFSSLAGVSYLGYKYFFKRDITKKGLKLLIDLEGKKNTAYPDVKGLMTIGVGHLIKPDEKNLLTKKLTEKEIENLLGKDLDIFEKVVRDTIKVNLKPHERDALIIFSFNVGNNAFKNSNLAKLINSKASNEIIKKEFSKWLKPLALINRRAKESRLFFTGNYSNLISLNELNKYLYV